MKENDPIPVKKYQFAFIQFFPELNRILLVENVCLWKVFMIQMGKFREYYFQTNFFCRNSGELSISSKK